MDRQKLKIVLVNHSDARGGAAVATRRLMNALRREGVDARMVVVHKDTDALCVAEAAGSIASKGAFLSEHAEIALHNGFDRNTLFKISTGHFGLPICDHPWVKEADMVILNWVNQGMMSLRGIRRLAARKPVVWVMHDQWNMTGICHYTDKCMGWLSECNKCPLLPQSKLAHKVYLAKKKLYEATDMTFVAVSHRLADICRQSPLMQRCDIKVIPNVLPVDKFGIRPSRTREQLGLPVSGRLVVMGAARLDDPVKNLPLAIEALNRVSTPGVTAVFYGNIRDKSLFERLDKPYVWLGPLDSTEHIQALMANSDVILSTSVWETLPTTVIEGVSTGMAAVATSNGGQADIIDAATGFIVDAQGDINTDSQAVARAIDMALLMPFDSDARQARHRLMAERFSPAVIARRYIALADSLLNRV